MNNKVVIQVSFNRAQLPYEAYPFFSAFKMLHRDTWVAQSVGLLTSAQVMISRFVGSSCQHRAWNLFWILSPSLSLCPSPTCACALSQK